MNSETSCEDLLRETVDVSEDNIARFAWSCSCRHRKPRGISERTSRVEKCFCVQGLHSRTIATYEPVTSG